MYHFLGFRESWLFENLSFSNFPARSSGNDITLLTPKGKLKS